ncbi:hypothetical protein HNQ72_002912 [Rhizobium wenxiniae]|uniref:Uncharacterized protein n=1 Tax=Rhizobium wenxiniae TaxID=1737357 RepID=A0A7W9Y6V2_9HYPH|nr:hypothetical protein [Rhizobium wenxiniae]
MDIFSFTAAVVAVSGLIAAVSSLLRELRNWRTRPPRVND